MKYIRVRTFILAAFALSLLGNNEAFSQASVSIGAGFDCFTDIDGSKTLGKLEQSGFRAIKFSAVNAKIEREIDALDAKADSLSDITNKPESLFNKLLKKFVKAFNTRFPDLTIQTEFDDKVQRSAVVKSIREATRQRKIELRAVVKKAKACKGGTTSPPQNGTTISPTIKIISFRGSRSAYAGFLVLTKPRKVKFSTKPGGFNVCTRINFPLEGAEVTGRYTGVGTDLCFSGSGIVDDDAVAACNATLPSGFVGLFIKKAQSTDISDEGLKNLEALIVGNVPTVLLRALDQFTGSRDKALAICEQFLR
jgi:hypothetical protein